MSRKAKFLLLLFVSFSGFGAAFRLFIQTDYARREHAWFKAYPYEEMAARKQYLAKTRTPFPATQIQQTVKIEKTTGKIPPAIPAIIIEIIQPASAMAGDMTPDKQTRKKVTPHKSAPRQKAERMAAKKKEPNKDSPKTSSLESWRPAARLGYEAYGKGDYRAAIRYFEQALKSAPDKRPLYEQLAYAHKKTGQTSRAVEAFKGAIDAYDDVPLRLKREVEQLEHSFEVNGYAIYRDESSTTRQLGADLTQSQTGVEISYRPETAAFDQKIQVYGRFLTGMKQGRLRLDPDSYQAGIGLRLKPLARHNLILSAERLIKIGPFARNDWMIRAGYSRDYGSDYRQDKTGWWSHNLYLDAALINHARPDFFLTGQLTTGYNMTILKGLVLQPRLTALATWQLDRFRQASLIEAGPGVNLRYYFNDSTYEAYRSYVDLTIEYRVKISGNSIGGSGPVIGVIAHF